MAENKAKSEYAEREEKVLEFWRENEVFKKTLNKHSPKGEFVFYEGPPTANGKPGIHHLESRSFKDAIPRYKTMRGYHVRRKGGWDTHGLPVELQVEKELGLTSKKEIEKYGIEKFNQKCKESVWNYKTLWEDFTRRIGYWLDLDDPYITYDPKYMESLWYIVGQIDKKGLLYKDYKVLPWCPRCGTALSSHELAQGYKDVKDLSIYAKFKVKNLPPAPSQGRGEKKKTLPFGESLGGVYFLAWTTTPWTLPGNVALAVGEDIDYVKVRQDDEILILAKARLSIFENTPEIMAELKGKDLVGLEYEPLYPYIKKAKPEGIENAYKVYPADFVTTEDGTGIVHTAVMYGQDDFELGTKVGLPKYHLVDETGKFVKGTGFLAGRFVREEVDGKPTLDVDIIKDLQDRNLFFNKEKYEHSYPHCWRCKTALIYYARDSWYIHMSDPKVKRKLISENKKINWEPEHVRDGRFGQWLVDVKDWAISRERYWGTPLPVWESKDPEGKQTSDGASGERIVVDSVETLREHTKNSGNKYFIMRHGGAEHNEKRIVNTDNSTPYHLTEKGKKDTEETGRKFRDKIDVIYYSPLIRCQETAEIMAREAYVSKEKVFEDKRLREYDFGDLNGKSLDKYWKFREGQGNFYDIPTPGGESFADIKKRFAEFIYAIDQKHKDQNILIICHGATLEVAPAVAEGADVDRSFEIMRQYQANKLAPGHVESLDFVPLPHNENYELDLHRPFIDEVVLERDGKEFRRVKEVMDVWFDSGAMPFTQDHWPFESPKNFWQKLFSKNRLYYPADFISEAVDQTRGWFYTLHAVGILVGGGRAYKNVICLGHILDEEGKKMSKSVGNIVDPWEMIECYGVDSLRLWMYSVNAPGESKNFDEKTVVDIQRQVFGLLYNVLEFYKLYRDESIETNTYNLELSHVLDQWIISRLAELTELCTKSMDEYKLLEPVRAIREFINDLSTWYLRRSRERIKNGDENAKRTLYFILQTIAQLLAPFAPFSAEDIWQTLRTKGDPESVHLSGWPTATEQHSDILQNMRMLRDIVSTGLKERQVKNVPVRQPLASATLKESIGEVYEEILKDELNVKEVRYHEHEENISLDFELTPELRLEGNYRELVRAMQDMRKRAGLTPEQEVVFAVATDAKGKEVITKWQDEIKRTVGASEIHFEGNDGKEIEIGELIFLVKILD